MPFGHPLVWVLRPLVSSPLGTLWSPALWAPSGLMPFGHPLVSSGLPEFKFYDSLQLMTAEGAFHVPRGTSLEKNELLKV